MSKREIDLGRRFEQLTDEKEITSFLTENRREAIRLTKVPNDDILSVLERNLTPIEFTFDETRIPSIDSVSAARIMGPRTSKDTVNSWFKLSGEDVRAALSKWTSFGLRECFDQFINTNLESWRRTPFSGLTVESASQIRSGDLKDNKQRTLIANIALAFHDSLLMLMLTRTGVDFDLVLPGMLESWVTDESALAIATKAGPLLAGHEHCLSLRSLDIAPFLEFINPARTPLQAAMCTDWASVVRRCSGPVDSLIRLVDKERARELLRTTQVHVSSDTLLRLKDDPELFELGIGRCKAIRADVKYYIRRMGKSVPVGTEASGRSLKRKGRSSPEPQPETKREPNQKAQWVLTFTQGVEYKSKKEAARRWRSLSHEAQQEWASALAESKDTEWVTLPYHSFVSTNVFSTATFYRNVRLIGRVIKTPNTTRTDIGVLKVLSAFRNNFPALLSILELIPSSAMCEVEWLFVTQTFQFIDWLNQCKTPFPKLVIPDIGKRSVAPAGDQCTDDDSILYSVRLGQINLWRPPMEMPELVMGGGGLATVEPGVGNTALYVNVWNAAHGYAKREPGGGITLLHIAFRIPAKEDDLILRPFDGGVASVLRTLPSSRLRSYYKEEFFEAVVPLSWMTNADIANMKQWYTSKTVNEQTIRDFARLVTASDVWTYRAKRFLLSIQFNLESTGALSESFSVVNSLEKRVWVDKRCPEWSIIIQTASNDKQKSEAFIYKPQSGGRSNYWGVRNLVTLLYVSSDSFEDKFAFDTIESPFVRDILEAAADESERSSVLYRMSLLGLPIPPESAASLARGRELYLSAVADKYTRDPASIVIGYLENEIISVVDERSLLLAAQWQANVDSIVDGCTPREEWIRLINTLLGPRAAHFYAMAFRDAISHADKWSGVLDVMAEEYKMSVCASDMKSAPSIDMEPVLHGNNLWPVLTVLKKHGIRVTMTPKGEYVWDVHHTAASLMEGKVYWEDDANHMAMAALLYSIADPVENVGIESLLLGWGIEVPPFVRNAARGVAESGSDIESGILGGFGMNFQRPKIKESPIGIAFTAFLREFGVHFHVYEALERCAMFLIEKNEENRIAELSADISTIGGRPYSKFVDHVRMRHAEQKLRDQIRVTKYNPNAEWEDLPALSPLVKNERLIGDYTQLEARLRRKRAAQTLVLTDEEKAKLETIHLSRGPKSKSVPIMPETDPRADELIVETSVKLRNSSDILGIIAESEAKHNTLRASESGLKFMQLRNQEYRFYRGWFGRHFVIQASEVDQWFAQHIGKSTITDVASFNELMRRLGTIVSDITEARKLSLLARKWLFFEFHLYFDSIGDGDVPVEEYS